MDGAGPTFEHVLDAHLAAQPTPVPRSAHVVDPRPDPGLLFALSGAVPPAPAWTAAHVAAFAGMTPGASRQTRVTAHPATDRTRPAEPAPRRRALGGAAREAHRRLRQWGAQLPDDFTVADLKRAYRQLARQYHPDQHPGATAVTRAALAGAFHQIHLMYRVLAESNQPA